MTLPTAYAKPADDEHIRAIVNSLLSEKDQKIAQLEARIKQLEQNTQAAPVPTPASISTPLPPPATATANQTVPVTAPTSPVPPSSNETPTDSTIAKTLVGLGKKVDELKKAAQKHDLDISGFFDINIKTDNATDQTFSVGLLELDLAYSYNEHFAASTALALCGNSAGADYATSPAHITCGNSSLIGLGQGGAAIAVGLIDFHMFDNSIPPRGRIFNNQGFHIQGGRFDVPFGSDYQNFANKDRITITSPITTVRIQKGGFNADGVRSYGAWGMFNYSAFWSNAVYENSGTSLGGRLGMVLGKNPYRIHSNHVDGIEFGVSYLAELDKHNAIRNAFYGADLSFGYRMLRLQNELMVLRAHEFSPATYDGNNNPVSYVKAHELAYHSTLIFDFEDLLKQPLLVFARYGRWQPKLRYVVDGYNGAIIDVNSISMLSLGVNYRFSDNLIIKVEYNDSLGTKTQEHYFDQRLGIAQIVLAF